MSTTIRVNFCKEVDELVYDKMAAMTKAKKRKVTYSEALETLLKEAYLVRHNTKP